MLRHELLGSSRKVGSTIVHSPELFANAVGPRIVERYRSRLLPLELQPFQGQSFVNRVKPTLFFRQPASRIPYHKAKQPAKAEEWFDKAKEPKPEATVAEKLIWKLLRAEAAGLSGVAP